MPVDKYQLLAHNDWEHRHLQAHSDLLKAFNDVKVKENMIKEQKGGKTTRRDALLTAKKNMTISKLGDIELALMDKEEVIEKNHSRNLQVIEAKRAKTIK